MSDRFKIGRLGAQGDGIAETGAGPLFIPFTLAGETVLANRTGSRADLVDVLEPSPLRVPPLCRHFGICGGCALQHMAHEAYRDWKRDKVVQALRGVAAPEQVAPLVACPPGTRRRVTYTVRRTAAGPLLGYNRALSHEIVDIAENPIARPEIVAALPSLRRLAALIARVPTPFALSVTNTDTGLDIAATGSGKLEEAARRAAADFVLNVGFARLSLDGEIVIEREKPTVRFGDVAVAIPPGAFLQATEPAEQAMAGLVLGHLARAKRVADLYAGVGTFALRLATRAHVHAVESDAAALAALDRAFRSASGLKPVTHEKRDLARRPLTAKELSAFDGVVFDPPRAGAEEQSKQLARSDVPFVAAVSCNPTTLARDCAILVAGGYRLTGVTPIDQFLWSPHVEAVALLEKPVRRRRP